MKDSVKSVALGSLLWLVLLVSAPILSASETIVPPDDLQINANTSFSKIETTATYEIEERASSETCAQNNLTENNKS